MTRKEHLEWCKTRALEFIDEGDAGQAITSMMSDIGKHDETKDHSGAIAILAGVALLDGSLSAARKFVEGFN